MNKQFVHKHNEFIKNICSFYDTMSHVNSANVVNVQKTYDSLISLAKALQEDYNMEKAFANPETELSLADLDIPESKAEAIVNTRLFEIREKGINYFKEKHLLSV